MQLAANIIPVLMNASQKGFTIGYAIMKCATVAMACILVLVVRKFKKLALPLELPFFKVYEDKLVAVTLYMIVRSVLLLLGFLDFHAFLSMYLIVSIALPCMAGRMLWLMYAHDPLDYKPGDDEYSSSVTPQSPQDEEMQDQHNLESFNAVHTPPIEEETKAAPLVYTTQVDLPEEHAASEPLKR